MQSGKFNKSKSVRAEFCESSGYRLNFNEYEWARAWANASKSNNCERTQTRTRAKFNESSESGQNLIKGTGAGKILSRTRIKFKRQVVSATSRACCGLKFYFYLPHG